MPGVPKSPQGRPRGDLRWSIFLRLHAREIIACDFFVAVTATFRQLSVFVIIEHRSRRLIHDNVSAHPSAALQQLREVVGHGDRYRFLTRDRDCIFVSHLDKGRRTLAYGQETPRRTNTSFLVDRRQTVDVLGRERITSPDRVLLTGSRVAQRVFQISISPDADRSSA